MHIAIDDTYGPVTDTGSEFVTGNRRTHVAIIFPDADVKYIREQLVECIDKMSLIIDKNIEEFHFVDIYNRNPPWNKLGDKINLKLVKFFADIYSAYRWPVIIQTVDDRTFRDHRIDKFIGKCEGLDLSNRSDLSLFWLLLKIRLKYKKEKQEISLIIDEGRRKAGSKIGYDMFYDWSYKFNGTYKSSKQEPLLQLADFVAFCINRSTHLGTKKCRTDLDNWFLNLIGGMGINCPDFKLTRLPKDFDVKDFDHIHSCDRYKKGL